MQSFPKRFIATIALLTVIVPVLHADKVTLKDGTVLQGRVLNEFEDHVVMEVRHSASIAEEKVIARTEISEIQKTTEAEQAYKEIAGIEIEQNSRSLEEYDQIINQQLKPFVEKYPDSEQAEKVKAVIASFEEEKKRVEAGERKVQEHWYSAEEVARNSYEIDAQLLFSRMQGLARVFNYTGALNLFMELEKEYGGSSVYPDAVELARQLIASYKRALAKTVEAGKIAEERWQAGLAITAENRKQILIDARNQEIARFEAQNKRLEATGAKWLLVSPLSEASVRTAENTIKSEGERLEKLNIAEMRRAVELTRQARELNDAGKPEEAQAKLADASKAWNGYKQIAVVTTEIKARQDEIKKAAEATPTPKEATPTPTPTATPAAKGSDSAAQGESKPFFKTIPGALTIVVLVGVITGALSILSKQKPRTTSH